MKQNAIDSEYVQFGGPRHVLDDKGAALGCLVTAVPPWDLDFPHGGWISWNTGKTRPAIL